MKPEPALYASQVNTTELKAQNNFSALLWKPEVNTCFSIFFGIKGVETIFYF